MRKWGILLMIFGGVIAVFFIFLPLYLPANPLSRLMLQPLFCESTETFLSETTYGVGINNAQYASPHGYCVGHRGDRREVTQQMVNAGLIAGGLPVMIGVVLILLLRFVDTFRQAMHMGQQQRQLTSTNPTTSAARFSKPPNENELREELGDPSDRR